MVEINLPNNWAPRDYQKPLWRYLKNGGKRALARWHRRAGKDDICLHWTACAAHMRVGTYWHMLPEASQARKAIWDAVNPHTGIRRVDEAFPREIRETTRENEMMIRFKNGSTWQLVGSDNYDSLVGSAPAGMVFSEWALADPRAWAYARPILAENDGWALFISTPRGRNHMQRMEDGAKGDPSWFVQALTVNDTGIFTTERLEAEKTELFREYGREDGERLFRQEYFVSYDAAIIGAYYAREMTDALDGKRIGAVGWETAVPVYTAWDLGMSDSTAIWCAQIVGREIRVIDYIENSGVGLDWYVNELRKRPYTWADHILPHDAEVKELGTGRSRLEVLHSLGLGSARIIKAQSVADGINAARMILPRCWFDAEKCERGIDALKNYRREWDEKRKVFHSRPLHDWSSHAADSFRYMALGLPNGGQDSWAKPIAYDSKWVV